MSLSTSIADRPVIIECAVSGGQAPNSPWTLEEMSTDIEAVFRSGASVVHNHPGEGASGLNGSDFYRDAWRPVLDARPDALIYPTISVEGDFSRRWDHHALLKEQAGLRIAAVDPGSVNLGGADDDGLPVERDWVYGNSPAYIRWMMDRCVELELAPTFPIFEPGFLRVVLAYYWNDRLPRGAMIRFYFSGPARPQGKQRGVVTTSMPPTRLSLDAYLAMMEGCDVPWSVTVYGGDLADSELPRYAVELGGHLRVGREDFRDWHGNRTPSNEELVREMVDVCNEVGRPIATCAQAAAILGIP